MTGFYGQAEYRVRCDWGPAGADAIGAGASVVAVVDVLSFTTALTVAADRGVEVFPYRWRDERAVAFAESRGAVLVVGRSQVGPGRPVSLSPVTIRSAQALERLVLPSPNGSTIARRLSEAGATVIGVSLRNAGAAASWTAARVADGAAVAVVASGERWPDGSLRPAAEDLWGAGAYIQGLIDLGFAGSSPEAEMAAVAYRNVRADIRSVLLDCVGGRELAEQGFTRDVEIAAEADAGDVVPVLTGESFRPVSGR
ncbi:2-phosphosulfolactate phosphatase [Actinoplanes sichuanensis]|uniref:Probable 2-phosphosulfolactate phosphatase n=1 Tax=Actinoplanes sichuanensis TaxID=512349 RepID=A0ABW4A7J8_9ACTN|nr:2-phosphosulfolactate phosphatase [Actinoplanes sichuanensis]